MFDRILILQHKGGEYMAINISGLSADREPIWETLDRAEVILERPSTTSNVAFQVLDSKLSKDEVKRITEWLNNMKPHIYRLAIIGATFRERIMLSNAMKRVKAQLNRIFVYDWESAKDWLVGKSEG